MSEAKVLHEWACGDVTWSVGSGLPGFKDEPVILCDGMEALGGVIAKEMATLAARVRELEDECAGFLMERGKLKGRTEQLEAAVRWKVEGIRGLGEMRGGDPFGDCAAEIEYWATAHPIVRSIIEKGGE